MSESQSSLHKDLCDEQKAYYVFMLEYVDLTCRYHNLNTSSIQLGLLAPALRLVSPWRSTQKEHKTDLRRPLRTKLYLRLLPEE